MRQYPEEFKAKMVEKLARPGGPSASALAEETGVPQTTLSRWLRAAGRVKGMGDTKSKRPQDWTAQEKLQAVVEAEGLSDEDLGAFLRRRGLHRAHLERWRAAMHSALERAPKKRSGKSKEARKIRELEKEVRRKDKALAEASTLLVLKKKPRRSGGTRTTTRRRGAAGDPGAGRRGRTLWSASAAGLRGVGAQCADGAEVAP